MSFLKTSLIIFKIKKNHVGSESAPGTVTRPSVVSFNMPRAPWRGLVWCSLTCPRHRDVA